MIGWRVWFVVRRPCGYRLASPLCPPLVVWTAGRGSFRARCQYDCGEKPPRDPFLCSCGWSAVTNPERAGILWRSCHGRGYLTFERRTGVPVAAVALGRVRLHGAVHPGRPYPDEIKAAGLTIEALTVDERAAAVADDLAAAYRVPVSVGVDHFLENERTP